MREKTERPYLTTTQAARLCHLSPSTLLRAIRDKKIRAFSTPGGHFRIERSSLEEYARQAGIRSKPLGEKRPKIMLVQSGKEERARLSRGLSEDKEFDILEAGTCFEAGYLMAEARPAAVILDADTPFSGDEIVSSFARHGAKVLILEGKAAAPRGDVARRFKKPVTPQEIKEALGILLN
jgi:excisionase family DNA binding protein